MQMQPGNIPQRDGSPLLSRIFRLAIVVLPALALLTGLGHIGHPLLWDEGAYLSAAENLGNPDPYFTEIGFRPPFLPFLLHAAGLIPGLELASWSIPPLLFACGVGFIVLYGAQLWGRLEGILAGVLLLSAPYFFTWSGAVLSDIPSAALATGSLVLLHRATTGKSRWWALAGGVLLAATFLTRWPALLVGTAALVMLLTRTLKPVPALLYGAGFAAGVVPYFVWAHVRYGNFLEPLRQAQSAIEGSEPVIEPFYYVTAMGLLGGPLVMAGVALYLFRLPGERWKDWLHRHLPLLAWAAVLPIYLSLVIHKESRYIAASIPPLVLLSAHGWAGAMRAGRGPWRMAAGIMGVAALLWGATGFDVFKVRSASDEDQMRVSADMQAAVPLLRSSLPPGGVVYSNHLYTVLGYLAKLPTIAIWPRDQHFHSYFPHNMPRDGVFVHVSETGKQPDREWLRNHSGFTYIGEVGRVFLYSYDAAPGIIDRQSLEKRIPAAADAYMRADWARATELLKGVNSRVPGVGCMQGWSLYKLGDIDRAQATFHQMLEGDPNQSCALTGAGYTALRNGDPASAERRFEAALAWEPESTDAMMGAGLALMRQGRRDEAAGWFRRVLATHPDHGEALQFLQSAQGRTGE